MKNKRILRFPVHSFAGLISNSSTEVYSAATDQTVRAVKKTINAILKVAKSSKTADDLFKITINSTSNDLVIAVKDGLDPEAENAALEAANALENIFVTYDVTAEYNG